MATIYQTNKKTGITYVVESQSYWDKEKQQPRSHRTIIGKIDPDTGEIVPTKKYNREKKAPSSSKASSSGSSLLLRNKAILLNVSVYLSSRLSGFRKRKKLSSVI